MRKSDMPNGETKDQDQRDTMSLDTSQRKSPSSRNSVMDNPGPSSGRIDSNNQPEGNQRCTVNRSKKSGPDLGEKEYHTEFIGKIVSFESMAEVLKTNSTRSTCNGGPDHWLNYLYSSFLDKDPFKMPLGGKSVGHDRVGHAMKSERRSDDYLDWICEATPSHWLNYRKDPLEGRITIMNIHKVFRKHMYSLACLNSDKLMADSLLNLMKDSSLVLAHVIDSNGSLNRTLSLKQWKELVKEKSFRDLFDSPEVKKSIMECYTTLGTESEADIQSTNCINYQALMLDKNQMPKLLLSTSFADAFSRLSGGNQANLRDAIKDNAAKSKEDSDFSYFVTHFDVQPEEHDQLWSEHLYAQAETDPRKLQDLIRHVFGRSQDTEFMLSKSLAKKFLHLLDIHNVKVCPPVIVNSVDKEVERLITNDADSCIKMVNNIKKACDLFDFRMQLAGVSDTCESRGETLNRFEILKEKLRLESCRLFSEKDQLKPSLTGMLLNCWLTLAKLYDENFDVGRYWSVQDMPLSILRCQQELRTSCDVLRDNQYLYPDWTDGGIIPKNMVFSRLTRCCYFISMQPELFTEDKSKQNSLLRSCFEESDPMIMYVFREELKNDVDTTVNQFRKAVFPATITDDAINKVIRFVFREVGRAENYVTLSLRKKLRKTKSEGFVTPDFLPKDPGRCHGKAKNDHSAADAPVTNYEAGARHNRKHDARELPLDVLDAVNNPLTIERHPADLLRHLIKTTLDICETAHVKLLDRLTARLVKTHTMEALETLLQWAKTEIFIWKRSGSRLFKCLNHLLKDVEQYRLFVRAPVGNKNQPGETKQGGTEMAKSRAQYARSSPVTSFFSNPNQRTVVSAGESTASGDPALFDPTGVDGSLLAGIELQNLPSYDKV